MVPSAVDQLNTKHMDKSLSTLLREREFLGDKVKMTGNVSPECMKLFKRTLIENPKWTFGELFEYISQNFDFVSQWKDTKNLVKK